MSAPTSPIEKGAIACFLPSGLVVKHKKLFRFFVDGCVDIVRRLVLGRACRDFVRECRSCQHAAFKCNIISSVPFLVQPTHSDLVASVSRFQLRSNHLC